MTANQNDWRSIDALTERQRAVVRSICQGKRNTDIGLELGISPQTVKNHMTAILARTGATDRTRLAYLYAKWEEMQRATYVGDQVDIPTQGGLLTFRVVAQNRLLVRVGRTDGPTDLIELTEADSQRVRALLLADIDEKPGDERLAVGLTSLSVKN